MSDFLHGVHFGVGILVSMFGIEIGRSKYL